MFNNTPMVKGIIFDLDGTLIKSMVDFPKMKRRMIDFIQKLNFNNTIYTTQQTTNEIILDLNEKMNRHNLSEVEKKKIFDAISEILTEVEFENINKVQLLPGVREFITEIHSYGIKLAILTRASEKYTKATLKITKLADFFTVIATRDDFTLLRAKPHQVALDYTIDKLGVPPKNIIFIGDHELDYTCARRGDIRFIGVLGGAYDRTKLNGLPDIKVVENFYELGKLVKNIGGFD